MPTFPFALTVVLSVLILMGVQIVLIVRMVLLSQRLQQLEHTIRILTRDMRTMETALRNLITRKPAG